LPRRGAQLESRPVPPPARLGTTACRRLRIRHHVTLRPAPDE
jgi:hypothetical protein